MKKIFLLLLTVFTLTGCATAVRYVNYTDQKFLPKPKYYFVTIYPDTEKPPATPPYYVIGRVEISGYTSDGVTPDTLIDQAKVIARKKGADAIITAKTEVIHYEKVYVTPGYVGRHHYSPPEYIPYSDDLLKFRGELITFVPEAVPKENK